MLVHLGGTSIDFLTQLALGPVATPSVQSSGPPPPVPAGGGLPTAAWVGIGLAAVVGAGLALAHFFPKKRKPEFT